MRNRPAAPARDSPLESGIFAPAAEHRPTPATHTLGWDAMGSVPAIADVIARSACAHGPITVVRHCPDDSGMKERSMGLMLQANLGLVARKLSDRASRPLPFLCRTTRHRATTWRTP